jgi:DNA-binding transcriptional LysR family regulator
MDFELRMLQHARALCEEGSFARAARALHLTQPALSRSILALERRTGIKLFDRNKGRVEPTDLGRTFLVQAHELLARAEALDREVATLRGTGTGRLAVGSGTFPTALFMAAAASSFLSKNPTASIRVVNDNWVALIAALRRRELDFIVAAPPPDDAADLVVRQLSLRQGRFLVRPGHPLLSKPLPSLADILPYPIISTSRLNSSVFDFLLGARQKHDAKRPMVDVACESTEMMRQIAAATDHVLLSPLGANSNAVEHGELVALPVTDPRIAVTFAVIRLRTRTLPPIVEDFITSVVAADRASANAERALASQLSSSLDVPAAPPIVPTRRRQQTVGAAAR